MYPSKQPPKPRDGVDGRKLNGQRGHPFQGAKNEGSRGSSHPRLLDSSSAWLTMSAVADEDGGLRRTA